MRESKRMIEAVAPPENKSKTPAERAGENYTGIKWMRIS